MPRGSAQGPAHGPTLPCGTFQNTLPLSSSQSFMRQLSCPPRL